MSNSITNSTTTSATEGTCGRGRAATEGGSQTGGSAGRGRGGNAGRGRNRANQVRSTTAARLASRVSLFKGASEGMNRHVFECFDEQGDKQQYAKSLEALNCHTKKTRKFSEDFASLFAVEASDPIIEKPSDLGANPSTTDEMISWRELIKAYVNRLQVLRGNLAAIYAIA